MATRPNSRPIFDLAAGWICLASGALNWWDLAGGGGTIWRILLACGITVIGLFLVFRGYMKSRTPRI